jgi:hypothetical protein
MKLRNDTLLRILVESIVKNRKSGEDDVITNITIELNKFETLKEISLNEEQDSDRISNSGLKFRK